MGNKKADIQTEIAQITRCPKSSRASRDPKGDSANEPASIAHISGDWMGGYVLHPEAISPAFAARFELRDLDNAAILSLWLGTLASLELWAVESGSEPRPVNSLLASHNVLDPRHKERQSTIESRFAAVKTHAKRTLDDAVIKHLDPSQEGSLRIRPG